MAGTGAGMSHLEYLQRIIAGEEQGALVAELLGMRMVAAEAGRVTFELDVGPQHSSPPGTLHGGILCDIADAAMGCANLSRLEPDEMFTTEPIRTSPGSVTTLPKLNLCRRSKSARPTSAARL